MAYRCASERCERQLGGLSCSAHDYFRALYRKEPREAANLLFGAIMRKINLPTSYFGEYPTAMIGLRDNPTIRMELAAMSHFSDYCLNKNTADNKILGRDVNNLCEGLSLLANGQTILPSLKREVFEFIADMGGVVGEEQPKDRVAKISAEAIIGL